MEFELPGGTYSPGGSYGYGYNGMEKDDELKKSLYATLFREGDVGMVQPNPPKSSLEKGGLVQNSTLSFD